MVWREGAIDARGGQTSSASISRSLMVIKDGGRENESGRIPVAAGNTFAGVEWSSTSRASNLGRG